MPNNKTRLDLKMVELDLVKTRSQAANLIRLSKVKLNNQIIKKSSYLVDNESKIVLQDSTYVGRAAYKLESILNEFKLDFKNKVVLDIGSSTGGFSEVSLRRGASYIIAIEKGKDQMDKILRNNPKIELHEKTDILNVNKLSVIPDIVLMDLSFISIREVLGHVLGLINRTTELVIMLKPQFETKNEQYQHKGVIKNQKIRRQIIKNFELWVSYHCRILKKADSKISGSKGNIERFYLLKKI